MPLNLVVKAFQQDLIFPQFPNRGRDSFVLIWSGNVHSTKAEKFSEAVIFQSCIQTTKLYKYLWTQSLFYVLQNTATMWDCATQLRMTVHIWTVTEAQSPIARACCHLQSTSSPSPCISPYSALGRLRMKWDTVTYNCAELHCTAPHCTARNRTALNHTALHWTQPHRTALN